MILFYLILAVSTPAIITAIVLSAPIITRRKEQEMGESSAIWLNDRIDFSGSGNVKSIHVTDRIATGTLPEPLNGKEAMPKRARVETGAQDFKMEQWKKLNPYPNGRFN